MDMTGEYRISAPRDKVWEALNDPEILKICIPGCEELNKDSETELSAKVSTKVGPVSAKFVGKVTLSDINPPEGYNISGEGQGGVAGFAKGGARAAADPEIQKMVQQQAIVQQEQALAQQKQQYELQQAHQIMLNKKDGGVKERREHLPSSLRRKRKTELC